MKNEQNLQTFVILDLDHPGAKDQQYKKRRNTIAEAANFFWREGGQGEIPSIEYSLEEQNTWKEVASKLNELWSTRAAELYLSGQKKLEIDLEKIPQMTQLNDRLAKVSGFALRPVAGLVESRAFLSRLADNQMLCTQYIRHSSRPEFTPEPDIIHEFLGHAPTFTDEQIVRISNRMGKLAAEVSTDDLARLEKIYWFTLEYGLLEEQGKIKAIGAGLLAGLEDQDRAFAAGADLRPFNFEEIMETPYSFSELQQFYYVLPSLAYLEKELAKWSAKLV
jgi:phenylalanine-4-hydroxylase